MLNCAEAKVCFCVKTCLLQVHINADEQGLGETFVQAGAICDETNKAWLDIDTMCMSTCDCLEEEKYDLYRHGGMNTRNGFRVMFLTTAQLSKTCQKYASLCNSCDCFLMTDKKNPFNGKKLGQHPLHTGSIERKFCTRLVSSQCEYHNHIYVHDYTVHRIC